MVPISPGSFMEKNNQGEDASAQPLAGRVAIVTGGTRGIGRAIVSALVRAGADCMFTYVRNIGQAGSLTAEAAGLGRQARPFCLDVRDFDGAKKLIEDTKAAFGRIDILVNNAGITRDRSLMAMSREDWSDVIDTDLTGVFNTTRAAIVTFLKQKSGSIVNVSSVGGIRPLPGQTNYAAAKAGVIGFTRSLAREAAPYNVRVNAVAPGFIESDMTAQLPSAYREKVRGLVPLGRFGAPEDVARVVLFLTSDSASYITGQVIQIDGGLGM
jgi:3-oxoacyl-[acyl-carrier protein] reductase